MEEKMQKDIKEMTKEDLRDKELTKEDLLEIEPDAIENEVEDTKVEDKTDSGGKRSNSSRAKLFMMIGAIAAGLILSVMLLVAVFNKGGKANNSKGSPPMPALEMPQQNQPQSPIEEIEKNLPPRDLLMQQNQQELQQDQQIENKPQSQLPKPPFDDEIKNKTTERAEIQEMKKIVGASEGKKQPTRKKSYIRKEEKNKESGSEKSVQNRANSLDTFLSELESLAIKKPPAKVDTKSANNTDTDADKETKEEEYELKGWILVR